MCEHIVTDQAGTDDLGIFDDTHTNKVKNKEKRYTFSFVRARARERSEISQNRSPATCGGLKIVNDHLVPTDKVLANCFHASLAFQVFVFES